MRCFLFVITTLSVLAVAGQNRKTLADSTSSKLNSVTLDTTFRVVYLDQRPDKKGSAFFVNGTFIGPVPPASIPPAMIDRIQVEEKIIQIKGSIYRHQVYIETKNSYKPNLMSLTELRATYTNLSGRPSIFSIDNEIITSAYDQYFIDQKNIREILVDHLSNKEEKIELALIKIGTRNTENSKKGNGIKIKGNEGTSR